MNKLKLQDKPIRILQVVGRMDRGGIETFLMNVYRNIDREKIQFDFLCHYGMEAEYNEEIRKMGGEIYEMPQIKTKEKTYYSKFFKYVFELNNFFKKRNEYRIVHGHMTNTASIYMLIAKLNGVKYCISHSHLSKSRKGLSGIITNVLQFPLEWIATDYFACSESAAKWLYSKKRIRSKNYSLINNSIDSDMYNFCQITRDTYRENMGIDDKFVIGHIGRFYHEKNHNFLIEVFSEIMKKQPNSELILIGDGVLKSKIYEKAKNMGLIDRIHFLGSRDDVPQLLQAMDVFVLPSFFEGLPMVGIEAQAAGLEIIMSDNITKEVDITGNVTFLPLNLSAEIWANKILEHNTHYERKKMASRIKKSGYDVKKIARELEIFYLKKYKMED